MSTHGATLRPATRPMRLVHAGRVLVETDQVVLLQEHYGERSFDPVAYFALAALNGVDLQPGAQTSTCPLKGEAAWFSAQGVADAAWSYPTPNEAVAAIAGHVAFDSEKGFVVEAAPPAVADLLLHDQTRPQLLKMLNNLDGWLDKAERFAADGDIGEDVLFAERLFPNMYTLAGQVQFACSNASLLVARLADLPVPTAVPLDETFAAVRGRVAETRAFIAGAEPQRFAGAVQRRVAIPLIDGMEIRGADMARDFSMANVYFHLTTAYGILRGLGVPLGKSDFLGPMALMPIAA